VRATLLEEAQAAGIDVALIGAINSGDEKQEPQPTYRKGHDPASLT
jgi:hypothetical protein